MRARLAATAGSLTLLAWLAGCIATYPVPVETRAPATLNMAPFARVLVAGFVGAGIDDVDCNLETVRLLRSQLRRVRSLRIVDASAMSLTDAAFTDATFWKRVGEEYLDPLILTGSVELRAETRVDVERREREEFDSFGRRVVEATPTVTEIRAHILTARLLFIDGRTGAVVHADTFREETAHPMTHDVPALSSYFELMDRVVPTVLGTVSDHRVVGGRVLLK